MNCEKHICVDPRPKRLKTDALVATTGTNLPELLNGFLDGPKQIYSIE